MPYTGDLETTANRPQIQQALEQVQMALKQFDEQIATCRELIAKELMRLEAHNGR